MAESTDTFEPSTTDDGFSSVGDTIRAQREQSKEFLSAQQDRLAGIESQLDGELDTIRGSLQQWQAAFSAIEQWHREIQQQHEEAEKALAAAEELQLKTQRQRRELAEKFAGRRSSRAIKTAETIARLEKRITELQAELAAADTSKLEANIAALKKQVTDEQGRAKRLEAEAQAAREEADKARTATEGLQQQVAKSRGALEDRAQQIKTLRAEVARLSAETSEPQADSDELERLRQEHRSLQEQLRKAESASKNDASSEQLDDLRAKYEMAVENVRTLKKRNEELERNTAKPSGPPTSGAFDWEAQKLALVASLDGEQGETPREVRDKVEHTVQVTDQIIAQKDKEIAALKAKCEARSQAPTSAKPAAEPDKETALGCEELEKLKAEWRDKLRAAEVDISVERAQNARVRSELEEKMRDLDAQLALAKKQTAVRSSDKQGKGWFRR